MSELFATTVTLLALLAGACVPGEGDVAGEGGGAGEGDVAGEGTAAPAPDELAGSLLPAIQLEGEPPVLWTLDERMAHHRVPGVSVALMAGGEIAWARGWGVADTETGAPVTAGTLFQAASISKSVAALAAMALVEEGAVALDAPVNDHLTSWRVPDNGFTADSAVTLRGILSHTAGLTVWGFPGYRKDRPFGNGQPVATNRQVLDGAGNTDPVRVYKMPGISWQYSGGGYTVMEQVVEDVTGRPFHEVARERVLEPAGMRLSTYEQPLPEGRWAEAARAHGRDGRELEGEWHNYPEQAAAGLWTTPAELLTLSAHLLRILGGGETDGIVTRETLAEMLVRHRDGEEGFGEYGLGFAVEGEDDAVTFGHGGSNAGFRARWTVYRDRGEGVAVMTNSDRGAALAVEIVRSVALALGWPEPRPETRARRLLSAEEAAAYHGTYARPGRGGATATVRPASGDLLLEVPGQGSYTIHAEAGSGDRFFDASDGQAVEFERDDSGVVVALVLDGRMRLDRRR